MSANVIAFKKREKPKPAKPAGGDGVKRLEALDILRGLCVIGMILVAYAGDWSNRFAVLNHADWQGLVLADMIFPGFLFCVGVALPMSFAARSARQTKTQLFGHVLWRAAALIVLGVVLNFIADPHPEGFRLPGILQRIGVCYALAGGLCLALGRKSDHDFTVPGWPVAGAIAVLVAGYAALLSLWTGPDCAGACFDSVHSLPAVVDRAVFTSAYMWNWGLTDGVVTFDPEGIVSTLGALVNVLLGVVVAGYVRGHGVQGSLIGLFLLGLLLILTGLGMNGEIPVIKKIWTPSFALVSAGFSIIVFVLLAVIADLLKLGRFATFAKVFGANATLAFVLICLFDVVLQLPLLAGVSLHDAAAAQLGAVVPEPRVASLTYSVILVAVIGLILWPLYRKRWFLKL
ncbi:MULTISPECIES: acyltransferase family protein [Asticcacaulis]|uniref:acyltransferase family protein n=1 Tax=Asticcacaulis TaxID=76890 RepID=UPI001AE2A41C|nr:MULTISPECIES: heparan-alpha-glucosaminide N-acetyltransferase domain-containing protein [Asticcacaulis]MBP2161384.1 putative acyltransferase [Asticcacaulis solisilvae]MDR6802429.1 putative acyltransferase [Asticcacaulis sp. BE141]